MFGKLKEKYDSFPVSIRATLWFFVCAFLQKAMAAISIPIFTRIMTSEEFGAYSVFVSWQGIINCIVSLNLFGGFYTQGLVKFDKNRDAFSASLQGLTITMTGLWMVVYFVFRERINDLLSLSTEQMLLMIMGIWATSSFSFWAVAQRVQYQYRNLVIVTFAAAVLTTVVGILFTMASRDKVTARICAASLVSVLCYTGLCISQLRKGHCFYSGTYWKYALCFAIPLVPHYLSQIVLNCSDRIMISSLVDNSAAGIYSLAYSISQIMLLFNTALLQTVEPWIYEKIQSDRIQEIQSVAYPVFWFIAVMNLLLIAFAPEIISFFAPSEYHSAIWAIPPIAMSVFFMFTYSFFALFEFYYEKTQYIAISTTAGAVLNILLNYVFIQRFGYLAAGYTTLICYIVYVVLHYTFMHKLCVKHHAGKEAYSIKKLLTLDIAFMSMGFAMMLSYRFFAIRMGFICLFAVCLLKYRKTILSNLKRLGDIRRQRHVKETEI